MAKGDQLKVVQTTKVTGQVDANDFKAKVAGGGNEAGSQGDCPGCQGQKRAGSRKAG